MARAGRVKEVLAEITGAPPGMVEQLAGRLGTLGYVQRKPGRYSPDLSSQEIAYLAVGILMLADGIHHTGLGITRDMPALLERTRVRYRHRQGGRVRFESTLEGSAVGSFVEMVATELGRLARGDDSIRGRTIGLTFAGDAVCGWIDQVTVGGDEGEGGRHEFGDWQAVEAGGFKREARFELPALLRIADLLRPEDGAA
jgi:hypothetical protein